MSSQTSHIGSVILTLGSIAPTYCWLYDTPAKSATAAPQQDLAGLLLWVAVCVLLPKQVASEWYRVILRQLLSSPTLTEEILRMVLELSKKFEVSFK